MMPIAPHIANECYKNLYGDELVNWPKIENKYLQSSKSNIVVQINGKKRSVISIDSNSDESSILEILKKEKTLNKYLLGKKIFKSIYIKGRIINLIIK